MQSEYSRELFARLRAGVLETIEWTGTPDDGQIRAQIDEALAREEQVRTMPAKQRIRLGRDLFDSLRRFDAITELLEDGSVSEIMVNRADVIFIEKNGKLQTYGRSFSSDEALADIIQMIVSKVNRQVNASSPIVDARLEDGSRINIVLPPVAVDGPVLTIRKFPTSMMTIERMVELGTLTAEAAEYLRVLVRARYNIFISGGTGSGKTTLLNALSGFIPETERVITIEDSAELKLQHIPNLVRLETKNASADGGGGVTIRDLIKSALRMRPDRVVVGEVRGGEVIDMLQAMNTGHDGSLSTGHANSPRDMLSRLATMVLTGGVEIPLPAVVSQIASAIDILIHVARLRDGSRRILSIHEVTGTENGQITTQELFVFRENGEREGRIEGKLCRTEAKLKGREKLYFSGLSLGDDASGGP